MRVLIAPDKFKGTLTAPQAADAIAAGVRDAAGLAGVIVEVDLCPVADGGEGTIHALHAVPGWTMHQRDVRGPMGAPVRASWLRTPDGDAVIESAAAVGLGLVPAATRDPLRATSFGVGELILAAVRAHARAVLVGLGGSATVDGGLGMACALGWRFLDAADCQIITPADLERLARIVPGPALGVPVTALCDVDNPLLGFSGAARVYGPQKGAAPQQVERLEACLDNLVRVCRQAGLDADPGTPGAGAAGGLGYALMAFLGARLASGAQYVLDVVGFDDRARRADVVITGEGRLDEQTARGKLVARVAQRAAGQGKAVLAAVGSIGGPVDGVLARMSASGATLRDIEAAAADASAGGSGQRLRAASQRLVARWFAER